jgi:hypothetical protein
MYLLLDNLLCPTKEESGMMMSLLSIKCSHVWIGGEKGDVWGQARDCGAEKWGVDPEHGTSTGLRFASLFQRATTPSKWALITFFNTILYLLCITCHKLPVSKYILPLQGKNKPRDRDLEHAFILGPYTVV